MDDKLPSSHFQALAEFERHYWWHQHRFRLVHALLSEGLSRQVRDLAYAKIADLGCGCGGFLEFLVEEGAANLAGFDYSDSALLFARATGVRVYPFDFEKEMPLASAPYHALTALDVLEHVGNEAAFLSVVRSSLEPGGTLVMTVPAFSHLFSDWDVRLRHFRRYSRPGMRALLERSGFRVDSISYFFSWVYPFALVRKTKGCLGLDGGRNVEFPQISSGLNEFLLRLGGLERKWLRHRALPIGSSLVVSATRE